MTKCSHVALTQVQQFVDKQERTHDIYECDTCNRVFEKVDGKPSRNYPTLSYVSYAFA